MKNENYYIVHGWMVNDLHLKGSELILYAIIYGFTQDGKSEFRGGVKYLQTCMNLSESNIKDNITRLEKKGLIVKTRYTGRTSGLRAVSPDIPRKVKQQKARNKPSYDVEKFKRDALNDDLKYERKNADDERRKD